MTPLISTWTLFPQVMATSCPKCPTVSKPRALLTRNRNTTVIDLTSAGSKKRRVGEGSVSYVGDYDKTFTFDSTASAPVKLDKNDWIHVRQVQEYLGRVKALLPCGHHDDFSKSDLVAVVRYGSSISIQLEGEILATKSVGSNSPLSTSCGVALFETIAVVAEAKQAILKTRFWSDKTEGSIYLQFDVYLHSTVFSKDLSLSEPIRPDRQDLIRELFPLPTLGHFSGDAILDLYGNLAPNVPQSDPPASIQPDELLPQLLPFQRRSVSWLLTRESAELIDSDVEGLGHGGVDDRTPSMSQRLPLTWERVTTISGAICVANEDLIGPESGPRGGILAEEMGLGKTVEMLALILLHKRKLSSAVEDEEEDKIANKTSILSGRDTSPPLGLIASAATLIITPPSILHQWASEIENHAPTLRVFIYVDEEHKSISAEDLAAYDVVVTTYPTLAKEINYTQQYERPRRFERQYIPRQSPFVKIHWWRVCLDEAQMIEGTTVSQAAAMTLLVPRVMSWAISGTPIRRHIEDLHSLLQFLKQDPLASQKRLWKMLISPRFRPLFVSCFQRIMHRHAKRDVAHELVLLEQHRLVYGIQFSDIERAHYSDMWDECLQECNLEGQADLEKMQSWLGRLRQTSCHPQIGSWTKSLLGNKDVHTIDTVLGIMLRKVAGQINSKERSMLALTVKRAILNIHIENTPEALVLLEEVADDLEDRVRFWKNKVGQIASKRKGRAVVHNNDQKDDDTEELAHLSSLSLRSTSRVAAAVEDKDGVENASVRYRDWVEQQYRVLFFMGAQYSDLGLVDKGSDCHRRANAIRERMVADPLRKFQEVVGSVMEHMHDIILERESRMLQPQIFGAQTSTLNKMCLQFKSLVQLMNIQLVLLEEWRSTLLEALLQPLEDRVSNDGSELTIDSYEAELTVHAYLHNYSRLIFFRKDLLTGGPSAISAFVRDATTKKVHDVMATERDGRASKRQKIPVKRPEDEQESVDSRLENEMFKAVSPTLSFTFKTVLATLESVAVTGSSSSEDKQRAGRQASQLKTLLEEHLGIGVFLEKELAQLQVLASARSLYNQQIQAISDTTLFVDSKNPKADIRQCLQEEAELKNEISKLKSRQTYLDHIAATTIPSTNLQEGGEDNEGNTCLICSDSYQYGLLTECGHVFCETCLEHWTKTHSKCPSCKSLISRTKLTRVTMVQSSALSSSAIKNPLPEGVPSLEAFHNALATGKQNPGAIHEVPSAITKIRIEEGYGSKIDSLVRHIRFLIQADPSVKCLVFSQWSRLLQLISESLVLNQIGHVRLDGGGGGTANKFAVQEFKKSTDKHVFMLHAKSQSAGLTLIQATHVFICEPLVNPALLAQAVSRVHRIGQIKETFVHYYLIQDSVEIPCFELFERKIAATAASRSTVNKACGRKDKKSSNATTSSSVVVIDDEEDNKENVIESKPNSLDPSTVTTASIGVDSQKGQYSAEQVLEDDLQYCFQTQLGMMKSLTKQMTRTENEPQLKETLEPMILDDAIP
ncbi:hypothetical protein BGZ83_008773 [Gryganskiella cystojenkinii]|nr:hypothetical protein BGZ83_008773 [Gryganskiella cystojenkinii]